MAASTPRKRLRDEMTCPICLDFFTEPVILKCGQNFCRACLVNHWVALPGNNNTCPHCTERVQQKDLKPNRQLANVVEIVKEFWVEGKQEAVKWTVCERHQEPQKHFCKEDGAPICAVCKHSEEHQTHNVVPVEEAAQEYKIQINRRLNILKKERLKMVESEAERERESEDLLKQTKAEKEKTVAEFGQLHLFLEEQEQLFLAKMEEVEKEIARRRAEHINRVREELSSLTSSIQEMEKMSQQSPGELLQNIGSTLQRCEEELPTSSVAFPLELKWSIVDICDIHSFLEGIMKEFKENLSSGLQLQKANVTLDADTAYPGLAVSEDRKSVQRGEEDQNLLDNSEKFHSRPFLLGCEGFTAGRHCWEVTVGSEKPWALGVARITLSRKDNSYYPELGFWAIERREHCFWTSDFPYLPIPSDANPKRIRVSLNYAGGGLAFFDADTAVLLFFFSKASFSGETLLPIFWVGENTQLTLSP